MTAMAFSTFSYVGVSVVLTLMVPYNLIADESGLPDALGSHGATWAKMSVIVGACCGMATVLIGTIYSLTRIVYAMSDDGLLFPWMSYVNAKTQIPLQAMFFFTSLGMILGIFVDITTLVEMMSIGTLIAYLVVSAGIIVIRYQRPANLGEEQTTVSREGHSPNREIEETNDETADEEEKLLDHSEESARPTMKSALEDIVNSKLILSTLDRYFQDSIISVCVFVIVLLSVLFCLTCKLFNKVRNDCLAKIAWKRLMCW